MPESEPRYKRPFDLTILIFAHIILFPLWLVLWTLIPALIWLEERGSVFYKQIRVGKNGKQFTVFKFRTMVSDADQRGPAWTVEGDPRLTRVGAFLRRTGLDELPELASIWRGDMSLVGPRALFLLEQQLLEEQIPGFVERQAVRPGLTGLAQIYDQTDEANTKLRYDIEYIQTMSLWLDIKLIILSIRNTLMARWDRRTGKVIDEIGGVSSRSRFPKD